MKVHLLLDIILSNMLTFYLLMLGWIFKKLIAIISFPPQEEQNLYKCSVMSSAIAPLSKSEPQLGFDLHYLSLSCFRYGVLSCLMYLYMFKKIKQKNFRKLCKEDWSDILDKLVLKMHENVGWKYLDRGDYLHTW